MVESHSQQKLGQKVAVFPNKYSISVLADESNPRTPPKAILNLVDA